MVSSRLVNVADDAELRLVRYLSETAPRHLLKPTFVEECEACIVQTDASALMKTIVNDAGAIAALLMIESAEEATSAFSLLAALLERVGDSAPQDELGLAKALKNAVVVVQVDGSDEAQMAKRRITLLSALYNLRSSATEKCALMTSMFQLAAQHQPDMLIEGQSLGNLLMEDKQAHRPGIVVLLDHWEVAPKDRRELYRAATDSLPDSDARKQRFTLLLIDTYTDSSHLNEEGINAAKEAAIGAIKDPISLFVHQRSMLTMPAIQALATKSTTEKLHGLLVVFQEGKLEDYHAFLKKYGGQDAISSLGLVPDECVRHMRILSLCSLAAEHEEIPYTTVAQTLELDSINEVESWVIAAVSSGLLSAKMDQLQQSVMVERSVVRKFDMEQWKALQSRLNLWKQNVRGILESFQQSQAVAPAP